MLKNRGYIKGTIAQITICVLVFPGIALIGQKLNWNFIDIVTDFVSQIPIMELWLDLLVDFSNIEEVISELNVYSEANLLKWSSMMYQIWVIGFVTEIIGDISKKLLFRGLPILPAFLTVIIVYFFQKFADVNYTSMVMGAFILVALYLAIKFFVIKASVVFTLFTGFFKLYVNSCVALATTAYTAILALIITGRITSIPKIFASVVMLIMVLVISLFVERLLSGLTDKK